MTARETRQLTPGTPVFCTVRGDYYGWTTVLAVRPRDGYIKIRGFWAWCPPHNFTREAP